jgi:hypothetical protein
MPSGGPEKLAGNAGDGYVAPMRFEKIWIEQCLATRGIKRSTAPVLSRPRCEPYAHQPEDARFLNQ